MMRRVQTHHLVGGLSLLQGVSFLTETYNLSSRALTTPLWLLDWVPGMSGQTAWGVAFVLIGVGVLLPVTLVLRAVALTLGTMAWAFFAVASLYEALFGAQHTHSGSLVGLLGITIVGAFLRATARLPDDFRRRAHFRRGHTHDS